VWGNSHPRGMVTTALFRKKRGGTEPGLQAI
jgi:hypothetical protein